MNEDNPKSEDNHDKSKDSKPSKSVSKSADCQTKKTAPADQREDCVKLDEDGRKHKGDMLLDATACVSDMWTIYALKVSYDAYIKVVELASCREGAMCKLQYNPEYWTFSVNPNS